MKIFVFVLVISFSLLYAEDKCAKLKTEADCAKERSCVWMNQSNCISTLKLVQRTSNSGFSSRSYDPSSNSSDRALTKEIPDPRSKRVRMSPPKKNEATPRSNP